MQEILTRLQSLDANKYNRVSGTVKAPPAITKAQSPKEIKCNWQTPAVPDKMTNFSFGLKLLFPEFDGEDPNA